MIGLKLQAVASSAEARVPATEVASFQTDLADV